MICENCEKKKGVIEKQRLELIELNNKVLGIKKRLTNAKKLYYKKLGHKMGEIRK